MSFFLKPRSRLALLESSVSVMVSFFWVNLMAALKCSISLESGIHHRQLWDCM